MPRYSKLSPADMSPAQKAVVDEIVSGKRGRFGGPFELLIRAPEVCKHLSRLGEYLRWGSSLSPALSELEICLTARHIRANYEWHAPAPLGGAFHGGGPGAGLEAGQRADRHEAAVRCELRRRDRGFRRTRHRRARHG